MRRPASTSFPKTSGSSGSGGNGAAPAAPSSGPFSMRSKSMKLSEFSNNGAAGVAGGFAIGKIIVQAFGAMAELFTKGIQGFIDNITKSFEESLKAVGMGPSAPPPMPPPPSPEVRLDDHEARIQATEAKLGLNKHIKL